MQVIPKSEKEKKKINEKNTKMNMIASACDLIWNKINSDLLITISSPYSYL